MGDELEERVAAALRHEAGGVLVPTMPDLPEVPVHSRRRTAGIALAVAAVVAIAVLVPVLGRAGRDAPPPPPVSQTTGPTTPTSPTAPTRPAILRSLADLSIGAPPELAYVLAGSSVVLQDRSFDLEWDVSAVGIGTTEVLVYDDVTGAIHRVGPRGIALVSGDATSPPVFGGTTAWIENDNEVVQQHDREQSRQPLPNGCCADARVVGIDVDMDPDIYVTSSDGAWIWDTYEGGEGTEDPPPDSEDYFWQVGGLAKGTVVSTGSASEVLVEYPAGEWGWGYVGGPRDPARDSPVDYVEQERVAAERVWLTSAAIVALQPGGTLSVLGSQPASDEAGHYWRDLSGDQTAFNMPGGLSVRSVHGERRRTVLVDATDESGTRTWVRCDVTTFDCEIATELRPDDVTPG